MRSEINDLGSKLAAQILLATGGTRLVIPSYEEWVGFNLLERDDELPARKKPVGKELDTTGTK